MKVLSHGVFWKLYIVQLLKQEIGAGRGGQRSWTSIRRVLQGQGLECFELYAERNGKPLNGVTVRHFRAPSAEWFLGRTPGVKGLWAVQCPGPGKCQCRRKEVATHRRR